jgi:3-deoxy-manno-octulosonate cytidylyltransferase (CMP-KDO synthetase)
MKILAVIPSRFASTRFPGKPLIDIKGKTMIQRVFEQAKQCKSFADVIVATDDERIYNHVIEFGGKAMMTSEKHPSGTDRCAEVLSKIDQKYDAVVNVQGDEPFIQPEQLDQLIECFKNPKTQIATLVKKIDSTDDLLNINLPKVIFNKEMKALYFSRLPIPGQKLVDTEEWVKNHQYYRHIGLYGYRAQTLKEITLLPPSPLENIESLEQLRWLEAGYTITVSVTEFESIGIDTPNDLNKIN